MKVKITRTAKVTREYEVTNVKEQYGFDTVEEWLEYEQSLKDADAFEALTMMAEGANEGDVEQGIRTEVIDG